MHAIVVHENALDLMAFNNDGTTCNEIFLLFIIFIRAQWFIEFNSIHCSMGCFRDYLIFPSSVVVSSLWHIRITLFYPIYFTFCNFLFKIFLDWLIAHRVAGVLRERLLFHMAILKTNCSFFCSSFAAVERVLNWIFLPYALMLQMLLFLSFFLSAKYVYIYIYL